MSRATKADQARVVNVAYRLLQQQMELAEAAQALSHQFALSRRQAYRYLEQAATLRPRRRKVRPRCSWSRSWSKNMPARASSRR